MTKVFTIGYEQRDPDGLIADLRVAGVDLLVDIRELPLSRRRGFSKTALATRLEAAGISYEHQRALGNPKPLRELYWSGQVEEGARGYRAHLRNGSAPAVQELAKRVQTALTCLLCLEHDERVCHRSVLVSELARYVPSLRVEHL